MDDVLLNFKILHKEMGGHGENQEGAVTLLEEKVRVKQWNENQEDRRKKNNRERKRGRRGKERRTVNGRRKKLSVHTPFLLSSTIIRGR